MYGESTDYQQVQGGVITSIYTKRSSNGYPFKVGDSAIFSHLVVHFGIYSF